MEGFYEFEAKWETLIVILVKLYFCCLATIIKSVKEVTFIQLVASILKVIEESPWHAIYVEKTVVNEKIIICNVTISYFCRVELYIEKTS